MKKDKKVRERKKPKTWLGKAWNFIWYGDSIASWIVSLLLAFVIVKFVFFPLLSLTLASSMPLVVVESESMHHPGSFIGNAIGLQDNFKVWWTEKGSWYEIQGISEGEAENWPFRTGLEMGDIVVISGYGTYEIGDTIVFNAGQRYPIIHRIVDITQIDGRTIYSTKGDNNSGQLVGEKSITEDQILGKAVMKLPKLGWVKLGFVRLFNLF